MTDEQIFEIASNHLHYDVDGDMAGQFRAEPHELLKFARLMYDKGQEEKIRRQKTGIGYVNDVLFVDEF